MVYKDLYIDFKKLFPENEELFRKSEKDNYVENSDNPHIPFGSVVVPYIRELLKNNEGEQLKKVFSFLEEMEKDKDSKVCEVVEFTVLGQLSDNKEELEKLKPYMGPETRQALHSMAWWLNINA